MKVTNLKINGVEHPMGFACEKLLASWKVTDTQAKKQTNARIEVSLKGDFSDIVSIKEGNLASYETELEVELSPRTAYYWRVTVTGDNGDTAVSETAVFETGKMGEAWQAKWIAAAEEDKFHPVLKKEFESGKKVSKGRLYICGLGMFEAYLNGEKIGQDYLAPFLTDYVENYQAIAYDVTDMVQAENCFEILLGKGWYMSTFGLQLKDKNFGDRMMAIAELHLEYEDGTEKVIVTDDSWQYRASDIEDSGIYFGEVINRQLWEGKENPWRQVSVTEANAKLVDRYGVSVKAMEELKAQEIIHTPAGETVVDFGQNHAGYMEFTADFPAGTTVKFEVGEILQGGNFYHDNYRDAESIFQYTSNGTKETVRPHFTFYGYRYLKVTGWPGELGLSDITAKVIYSELERTGYIETSNAKINQLYSNAIWGQKSNFVDIPTDCPQRSERLGWTGDTQVFAPTASYNMDTRAFYSKFMRDLRTEQLRHDGAMPNFFPSFDEFGGSSIWGDVGTFVPNAMYQIFGSIRQMELYYPMMRDWVEYMHRRDIKDGDRGLFENDFSFGDWLALDGVTEQSFKGSTDDHYLDTAYYYESARILSDIGEKLGYAEDAAAYKALAKKIKNAFLDKYVTPMGRLSMDTQAGYVVALKFGLYRDKEVIIRQFKDRLKKDGYQIKCGFVGAPLLCLTLCENGMEDLAYHFLFNEEFPSWLYCVNLGATTIWERWNSVLPDGTISGTGMNSLNHYSYGSVVEFMYKYIGGIRADAEGFKKAVIAPVPDMRFRFFRSSYDSVSGKYASNWEIMEDGKFHMHVEVPFDCTAKVYLPRYSGKDVELGEDGSVTLEAGSYDFDYTPSSDYRMIYGPETKMSEVTKDEEVMKILQDKLPKAYGAIMDDDREFLYTSFEEVKSMFYMGFTPQNVKEATDQIFALIRW